MLDAVPPSNSLFSKMGTLPAVPMLGIEIVWFQVAGTLCNLACTHCFISCSPQNHTHKMLSLSQIRQHLEEAERLAVKEFCFTGGEPFLNREMVPILEETLKYGPALVLTNGMLINSSLAQKLKVLSDASEYSLDLRVSLDSVIEEENDEIRGPGCFRMALRGVAALAEVGFIPNIATVRVWPERRNEELLTNFKELLEELGVKRFRLKIFEPFKMGAEQSRSQGYAEEERVTWEMVQNFAPEKLQCSTSRMIKK